MVELDTIKYYTVTIQKEDLQNCWIQVHLQIIFKLELWRLVEIC